ncbi:uncharacterized protein EI90DRAFT_3060519 [Cantharellus anzutake]|uniref:uncharacterized protein n=1 Tax=Cantharellus anzutake TaxID=1750568 RepID=UPI0019052C59|nr:uncharacterized protein EI90DRAFT_3060519 [Cantharellus anzutake]KAF8330377.1 hypothetical protein EI90DRAFT_3060519 [Cantharellus anzutake]
MPSSTDANWPESILKLFESVRILPPYRRYPAPFNRLLHHVVADDSYSLFVSMHNTPYDTAPLDPTDFFVFYLVTTQQQEPVLIVGIKDDRSDGLITRLKADAQIRQWYEELLCHCPIPRLYGLSLLGTSLRIYCGHKDTGDITPCIVDRPSADCVLPLDFLEGEWDLDLMSPAGFNRMQEIAAYVKAEVANIENEVEACQL